MAAPLKYLTLFGASFLYSVTAQAVTSTELWNAYKSTPNTHLNIPNCSYAGYKYGSDFPSPAVVANVRTHGAKGDSITDDTAAFKAALNAASAGGIVYVPAGRYVLNDIIHLKTNGVILKGDGPDKTIIDFKKNLTTLKGALPFEGSSQWSWCGGLVWFGPADTFDSTGKVVNGQDSSGCPQKWEHWRPGSVIGSVSGTYARGSTSITLSSVTGLAAGQMVLMTWDMGDTTNFSFMKHVAGHPLMNSYSYSTATWTYPPCYPRFQWPVEIQSVSGNTVTLKQPLRVDIRPEWNVRVENLGNHVRDAGVQNIKFVLHAPMTHTHLTNTGWNGVYVNRAYNCFVDNVEIQGSENPLILAAGKLVSINNVNITGPESHHHSMACRVNTHDCLFQNFVINAGYGGKVKHGINVEWFSSGNVWSRGSMNLGTFDSHRGLSFDNVRTDITTSNSADGPGGAGQHGPFLGARMTHWNVNVSPVGTLGGQFIFQPDCHSYGALVGIRGVSQVATVCGGMVAGDKGVVIADAGVVPNPTNLYDAEYNLRVSGAGNTFPTVSMTSPSAGSTFAEGQNVTFSANASDVGGTVSKVDFYAGTILVGTDVSSPYSVVWNNAAPGTYGIKARVTDNLGARGYASSGNFTVKGKTATQSSTCSTGDAARAIDGITNGAFDAGSVTHTCSEAAPWWHVDLASVRSIGQIKVWNRTDCCSDRLRDFYVFVSDTPFTSNDINTTKAQSGVSHWFFAGIAPTTTTVTVNRTARYVRVQLSGSNTLSLAEVEFVFGAGTSNPAPTVSITSPVNNATFSAPASIGINASASDSNGTVSSVQFFAGSTSLGTDATAPYSITWSSVAAGAYALTARATDNGGAVTTSTTVNVTVAGTVAGGTNIAQGKSASQSSTYGADGAQKAVDGNTDGNHNNGSVTHTLNGNQNWWQVDLGSVSNISSIKVWNRTDCCQARLSNFYVFVSDVPFTSNDVNTTKAQSGVSNYLTSGTAPVTTTISVGRTGRYVRVQLTSTTEPLSLAEVQVFN